MGALRNILGAVDMAGVIVRSPFFVSHLISIESGSSKCYYGFPEVDPQGLTSQIFGAFNVNLLGHTIADR